MNKALASLAGLHHLRGEAEVIVERAKVHPLQPNHHNLHEPNHRVGVSFEQITELLVPQPKHFRIFHGLSGHRLKGALLIRQDDQTREKTRDAVACANLLEHEFVLSFL